ncbi:hypothetical protein [uncultured Methylobacterium sp.]|uniref:hypothetical protein n=1 Tax=uncultured Methylobacterium sp. TaxID=157278 RepID=UPI0035CC50F9
MTAAEKRHATAAARMIAGLPKGGALVIVHAHTAIRPMKALIAARRGAGVAAAMRVVAAPSLRDETAIVGGTALPVHRDPFVATFRAHARAIQPLLPEIPAPATPTSWGYGC